jgi:uncharacterized membrane protein YjjP (DUF1212 family)
MEKINQKNKSFEIAQQKVKKIKSFYNHLFVFMVVHFFISVAVYTSFGNLKKLLILSVLGWGIGLFVHALKTFQWNPFINKEWEQRKIQEFLKEQD